MKISRERKVAEAVERMKALDIAPEAIKEFEENGTVMSCEGRFGGLYDANERQQKLIKDFETEHNALVYMIVHSAAIFGIMDSLLYICDEEEEWEYDNEDILDDVVMTYTHNYTDPDCSEFGSIGIRRFGGGLIRVS